MPSLDHVGLRASNLDRSIPFYRDMFGLVLEDRRFFPGGTVEAAMMRVGRESVIFLLCDREAQPWPPSDFGRPEHFCLVFEPDAFAEVMARLEAAGVFDRLDCDLRPRTGAQGRTSSKYILDPDNNIIEVKIRVEAAEATEAADATGAATDGTGTATEADPAATEAAAA
jgi:catechol 2,3-dioxygenase-like lactoylglutathione lyase family enzyme